MSLRARVLVGIALVAAVLALAAVAITRTTEDHLVDQVDEQLAASRGPVRGFDLDGRGRPGGPRAPGGGQPRLSSLYVAFIAASGAVTVEIAPDLTGGDPPVPDLDGDRALAAAATGEPFTVGTDGGEGRYRLLATEAGPGGAVVVVGLPLDDVDRAVDRLVTVEVVATLAVLAALALVAWWVVHLGVRPVQRMTAAASAIAAGDLSHRVPEGRPGTEAGDLGVALNRMLGRIEQAFHERARSEERLRRFVGDASHELRTPVTTIRGYAELYRSGGLDDPADLREAMRRTEQEAVRMGRLVDDLLHLARLDQGRPLQREAVDLAAVAADAVRDARAVEPGRPVEVAVDGPATVVGDEERLRQLVANLVANALVHTAPGTPVEVRVAGRDGRVVLEVADRGPGMAEDVAARAFERFYRADPSRSRHRGGSGLGLAIVQATVAAHGGTVALDTAPERGTTVRVDLPAGPA